MDRVKLDYDHPYVSYLASNKAKTSLSTSIYNYIATFLVPKKNKHALKQCAFCLLGSRSQTLLTCEYVDGEGGGYNLCAACSQKSIDRRINEMEKLV